MNVSAATEDVIDVVVGAGLEGTELDQAPPDAQRLIAEATAIAGNRPAGDDELAALVVRYWRFVSDEEMIGRTPEELVGATLAHRELAARRPPGEAQLRVSDDPVNDYSVLEVVVDDLPFLVDSVTAALAGRDLDVHLLVHPVVVVRRDAAGGFDRTRPEAEPADAGPDDVVESWIRVEITRVGDDTQLRAIGDAVGRALADVRAAVDDWSGMRDTAVALAAELTASPPPVPDGDVSDAVELLRWLADDNFTFLGYREYRLVDHERGPDERGPDERGPDERGPDERGRLVLAAVPGTGLGILRAAPASRRVVDEYPKVREKRLLVITKANSRATVHRSRYLDYISVKTFDAAGEVAGERRFLGLFGSAAYRSSVAELPVVRRLVGEVTARVGLSPRGHSGRELMEILETYPRDDLFQVSADELGETVLGVLRLAGRRQVRLFVRRDVYGRFVSCLVYLPRDRFTTANRLRIQEILMRELGGVGAEHTARVSDSVLARLHFIVRTDPGRTGPAGASAGVDLDRLTQVLNDATRLWDDDFRLVLERRLGRAEAKRLYHRYGPALPASYKEEHDAYEAVKDIARMELMDQPGQVAMRVYRRGGDERDVRLRVLRFGEPMVLSAVLPVPHSFGVDVTDERPHEVRRADGTVYMYDFALKLPPGSRPLVEVRPYLESAFSAVWRGVAEIDGYNALVLTAGLTWRHVVVLRAYARYLHQAGTVYSREYLEQTLVAHPDIAAGLAELFTTRFDPDPGRLDADRAAREGELVAAIRAQIDRVANLDQDRILRVHLTLIQATLRTTFFQRGADDRPLPYLAVKLDPQAIPDLPAPRPSREIFVYSPRFEGVHLRFGAVARGGLRWSDRRDDLRPEILGLVKAQMVKNAVIVPTGAKGGFVLKRPLIAGGDDALRAEGVECYQLFVSALLDLTDNIEGGRVVPPRDVVRHDRDDPYLVVAADKGTASFSDFANEISQERGYWLGDAFASGGSAGYDHKKMGITARGAWESVRRHFRELGVDVQAHDFTAVGIGDMSGDVFGNGMLLSRRTRLIAAFDHRHIFLDPTPDAATSYAERRRLFDLARSSWDDYDPSLISPGGGVWPRTAKVVPVAAPVRAALGIDPVVTALTPVELVRAILTAPVDLLWSGGIGTFVKAATESHPEVGDKTNDPVRVDGCQLRCRVVGEGGNLGLTQAGRVEYAMRGGLVNADFIDNSAGVDCSDHEVNIKILLAAATAHGELDRRGRDTLLAEMTGEVGAAVVRDNYLQACVLGDTQTRARTLLPVHRRMISELERRGLLDRALEGLPDDEALAGRMAAGAGLSSPELAVLLAYTRIAVKREIGGSALCDEPWTGDVLADYFPSPLRPRYAARMADHPLRREIVTTQLVNEAVNRGGVSFFFRTTEETGVGAADVLRGYVVARHVFGLDQVWPAVESLDDRVAIEGQMLMYLDVRRLLDKAVRWLVSNRPAPLDVAGEIERVRPGVRRLLPRLGGLLRGREKQAWMDHRAALVGLHVPERIAEMVTSLNYGFGLLDVVAAGQATGVDAGAVAHVYFVLSERFRVDYLLSKIAGLPKENRWQTLARTALRYDLYAALAELTTQVLTVAGVDPPPDGYPNGGADPEAGVEARAGVDAEAWVAGWEQANAAPVARLHHAIAELADWPPDLAALSVLLRQIRTVVRTSTGP
jgi:glutamate dehydrogenase